IRDSIVLTTVLTLLYCNLIYRSQVFFFCFFISLFGTNRRLLLSFPTRRSSDLKPAGNSSTNDLNCAWSTASLISTSVAFKLPYIDRKSTRLNSSHVSISYAVFCLKKKIQIYRAFY